MRGLDKGVCAMPKAKRLVIVDDDPAMGQYVRDVAEPLGYAVDVFIEGEGFRAAVGRDDPDLIILDLTMPGADGIELLRYLSKVQTKARILIMSGFDSNIREMAFLLGKQANLAMFGILPKPVRTAELRLMLTEAMGEAGG
ncbi:MAG TPA: response regulator [Alphaproteobacteria bacterium]|nr:response regulator [Alphaproteobacteria bacterium]